LTDKKYFIQRILNSDQRFAKRPAYIYSDVAFLENQQLQRNINLSGRRGKKIDSNNGHVR